MSLPTTKRAAANLFRKAANAIVEAGWIQNDYGSFDIGFCLLGAFHPFSNTNEYDTDNWVGKVMWANKTLPAKCTGSKFNDFKAAREEDVVQRLRLTANRLEHGGKLPT